MFALALLCMVALARAGEVVVDVLNVGQGDAILIRTPAQKTILIDAGDRGSGIVDQLTRLGVDHLDLAVATHPHADHVGSMEAVVRALPPRVYIDNGLPHTTATYTSLMAAVEANPAIAYRAAERGQVYNLDDGAKIEVLGPVAAKKFDGTRSDLNSNSVILRLTHGDDCFFFPGDAEEPTERALIERDVGECEVLKVAHHGSRHSTIAPFLDEIRPKTAVISVGIGNRYHHPGDETLARLEAAKVTVFRTDRDGRVTLRSTGKGIQVETERHDVPGAPLLPVKDLPGKELAGSGPAAPAGLPRAKAGGEVPAPAPDVLDGETCPFAASSGGRVYHESTCGNAQKISPANLVCYPSEEAAEAAGKRAAKCCDP